MFPINCGAANEPQTASTQLKGQRLNELGLWDLGNDGLFEIFTTSVSGDAGCFRADNLMPLWQKNISSSALTAPVLGNFLGTGSPILAFATAKGEVFFVWPGSGEIIATQAISSGFTLPPSVVRLTEENHDALVLPDDNGQIFILTLGSDGSVKERWKIPNTISGSGAFSVVGRTIQPASCEDINRDGIPEITVSSNEGVLQVISLKTPVNRHFVRLAQQSQASTIAGVAPFIKPDNSTILIGVDATLYAFEFNPAPDSALTQLFQTPAYGKTLGHLVFAAVNGDSTPDVLTSADNVISARYAGQDFNGKQTLIDIAAQQLTTISAPFSPAIPIIKGDGSSAAIAIDGKGAVLEWQPTATSTNARQLHTITPPTGFAPAGNLTGSGKLSLITWTEASETLAAIHLDEELSKQSPPALTLGVSYARNGQFGAGWLQQLQDAQTSATAAVNAAKAALASSPDDSEQVIDAASTLMGSAPADPIAAELFQKKSGPGYTKLILGAVVGIGILGGIILLLVKRRKS